MTRAVERAEQRQLVTELGHELMTLTLMPRMLAHELVNGRNEAPAATLVKLEEQLEQVAFAVENLVGATYACVGGAVKPRSVDVDELLGRAAGASNVAIEPSGITIVGELFVVALGTAAIVHGMLRSRLAKAVRISASADGKTLKITATATEAGTGAARGLNTSLKRKFAMLQQLTRARVGVHRIKGAVTASFGIQEWTRPDPEDAAGKRFVLLLTHQAELRSAVKGVCESQQAEFREFPSSLALLIGLQQHLAAPASCVVDASFDDPDMPRLLDTLRRDNLRGRVVLVGAPGGIEGRVARTDVGEALRELLR